MSSSAGNSDLGSFLTAMSLMSALSGGGEGNPRAGSSGGHSGQIALTPGQIFIPRNLSSLARHKYKLRGVRKVSKIKKRLLRLRLALKTGELQGGGDTASRSARHVKMCFNTLVALEQKTSFEELAAHMHTNQQLLRPTDGTITSRLAAKALSIGFGKLVYKLAQQADP